MKISEASQNARKIFFRHGGDTVRFMLVQLCMTLASLTPLLFLVTEKLKFLALLAIPFYLLLMLWARVNAAAAMQDALAGGALCTFRLVDPAGYGQKLLYGLKRCFLLLLWSAPLIAGLIIARVHISGDVDGFTVLRMIRQFGGGDLMTGVIYLGLILIATLLLVAFGCAFHSGDRHAFVLEDRKLIRGHHGKLILCWLSALLTLIPFIVALIITIIRYLPVLGDLNGLVYGTVKLPSMKITLLVMGIGTMLTIPFLPLRSLTLAAFVRGLKEKAESTGNVESAKNTENTESTETTENAAP